MQGKRQLLIKILNSFQIPKIYRLMSCNRLIVYNYHRIQRDDIPINNTIFDEDVFEASASLFYQQMKWLKNNTEIISQEQLLEIIRHGGSFSNPSSLVTFDDGYIDNYLIAYPILRELGIPAIFFIPTQQISERELGWWDIISYLIKKTKNASISFRDEQIHITDATSTISYFLNIMKLDPYENTINLLNQLSDSCGVPLPDKDIQSQELMTWDQIREVSHNGIAIGSHTNTHRVLATIPEKDQKEEMLISKEILETELDTKIYSIAYPVGDYDHFSLVSQSVALQCGYELGFSYNTGINLINTITASDIKRIASPTDFELFKATTSLPYFLTGSLRVSK